MAQNQIYIGVRKQKGTLLLLPVHLHLYHSHVYHVEQLVARELIDNGFSQERKKTLDFKYLRKFTVFKTERLRNRRGTIHAEQHEKYRRVLALYSIDFFWWMYTSSSDRKNSCITNTHKQYIQTKTYRHGTNQKYIDVRNKKTSFDFQCIYTVS